MARRAPGGASLIVDEHVGAVGLGAIHGLVGAEVGVPARGALRAAEALRLDLPRVERRDARVVEAEPRRRLDTTGPARVQGREKLGRRGKRVGRGGFCSPVLFRAAPPRGATGGHAFFLALALALGRVLLLLLLLLLAAAAVAGPCLLIPLPDEAIVVAGVGGARVDDDPCQIVDALPRARLPRARLLAIRPLGRPPGSSRGPCPSPCPSWGASHPVACVACVAWGAS